MEYESFYSQLNEEIERKQNIISAFKKILQEYDPKPAATPKKRDVFSGRNLLKKKGKRKK